MGDLLKGGNIVAKLCFTVLTRRGKMSKQTRRSDAASFRI